MSFVNREEKRIEWRFLIYFIRCVRWCFEEGGKEGIKLGWPVIGVNGTSGGWVRRASDEGEEDEKVGSDSTTDENSKPSFSASFEVSLPPGKG